jgi:hypothetical protein
MEKGRKEERKEKEGRKGNDSRKEKITEVI